MTSRCSERIANKRKWANINMNNILPLTSSTTEDSSNESLCVDLLVNKFSSITTNDNAVDLASKKSTTMDKKGLSRKWSDDIDSSRNMIKKSKTMAKQSLVDKLAAITQKLEEAKIELEECHKKIDRLERSINSHRPESAIVDLTLPSIDWSKYYIN